MTFLIEVAEFVKQEWCEFGRKRRETTTNQVNRKGMYRRSDAKESYSVAFDVRKSVGRGRVSCEERKESE